MQNMSLEQIAGATGGTYHGAPELKPLEINGVAIDSRKIEEGYLFVPIKGVRVDGHDFIPQVMQAGALCTLTEHELPDALYPYIIVASCEQALKDLARYYRNSLDIKVIGITGSVGKTSTKEMIASILAQKYKVLKTEGNYNNEIGLPLTIFNIRSEHEIAILEMGIDHFGEMHRLADVAQPDISVITNIGMAHMENLGSREGILKAKTEMFDHLKLNASIVLNGDDDMLTTVSDIHGIKPAFFGLSESCDIYASNIRNQGLCGTGCNIHFPDGELMVTIPIPGEHMVYNALAGACIGQLLGLDYAQIKMGIESLTPVSGRNNIIQTDDLVIIDDCYNANPVSMKASLDVLTSGRHRKVAVMGDMFELGADERILHYEIGQYAAEKGIDLICCIGDLAYEAYQGAKQHTDGDTAVSYFLTKEDFIANLQGIIRKNDTVLVKASNGMKFTELVEKLKLFKINK